MHRKAKHCSTYYSALQRWHTLPPGISSIACKRNSCFQRSAALASSRVVKHGPAGMWPCTRRRTTPKVNLRPSQSHQRHRKFSTLQRFQEPQCSRDAIWTTLKAESPDLGLSARRYPSNSCTEPAPYPCTAPKDWEATCTAKAAHLQRRARGSRLDGLALEGTSRAQEALTGSSPLLSRRDRNGSHRLRNLYSQDARYCRPHQKNSDVSVPRWRSFRAAPT